MPGAFGATVKRARASAAEVPAGNGFVQAEASANLRRLIEAFCTLLQAEKKLAEANRLEGAGSRGAGGSLLRMCVGSQTTRC